MEGIRVLLLCGNRFALQVMQELAFMNQLAAVAVPAHCGEWLEHIDVAFAGLNIPVVVVQRETCEAQLADAFKTHSANLGLVVTFSFRVPSSVIAVPEKGFFNVHPGPLPEYRGPDPIFRQIRNRERYAAVSIHELDAELDTGPVVMRERIALLPSDTHGILSSKLSVVTARLVHNLIKVIVFGMPLPAKPQDPQQARYYKRQAAADVSINWEAMNASEIVAQINACNPWNKGASTKLGPKILRLAEAIPGPENVTATPGTILGFEGAEMIVACKGGTTLRVRIVSTDEGIMTATRLTEFGVIPGQRFELI